MSRFDPADPRTRAAALEGMKLASRVSGLLGGAGAGLGVGAGLGMLGGGLASGVGAYRQAREHGAGVGQALGSSVGAAATGAVSGGALGAGVGALGGAATGALAPKLTEAARSGLTAAKGPVGAFARFGQRQVHGLTGHTPAGGLAEIGHGASTRLPAVRAAEHRLEQAAEHGGPAKGLINRALGRSEVEAAAGELRSANQSYGAGLEVERRGMTSLPGYAKAVVKDPVGALRAGFRDQWHGMSPGMKAVTMGLPALDLATNTHDAEGRPLGAGERVGRAAAGVAGMALSPLPQGTQMLLQSAPMVAGMARGRRGPPPQVPPTS